MSWKNILKEDDSVERKVLLDEIDKGLFRMVDSKLDEVLDLLHEKFPTYFPREIEPEEELSEIYDIGAAKERSGDYRENVG